MVVQGAVGPGGGRAAEAVLAVAARTGMRLARRSSSTRQADVGTDVVAKGGDGGAGPTDILALK
jgi:hypothetical protein